MKDPPKGLAGRDSATRRVRKSPVCGVLLWHPELTDTGMRTGMPTRAADPRGLHIWRRARAGLPGDTRKQFLAFWVTSLDTDRH